MCVPPSAVLPRAGHTVTGGAAARDELGRRGVVGSHNSVTFKPVGGAAFNEGTRILFPKKDCRIFGIRATSSRQLLWSTQATIHGNADLDFCCFGPYDLRLYHSVNLSSFYHLMAWINAWKLRVKINPGLVTSWSWAYKLVTRGSFKQQAKESM